MEREAKGIGEKEREDRIDKRESDGIVERRKKRLRAKR